MKNDLKLKITLEVLNELNALALTTQGFPSLSYCATQQALVIESLIKYFAERGLELPFEMELPHEQRKQS